MDQKLIFELSGKNTPGYEFPILDINEFDMNKELGGSFLRKTEANLPEVAEIDVVRHYTGLSRRNFGVDIGFYPLGSCTMKYNPKINEETANLDGFKNIHPMQPQSTVQGILELQYNLLESLAKITGMKWGTLTPFAGAHGEYTGMKLFKAYFKKLGQTQRTKMLIPDSAHGTNPASAHIAGFEVVEIKSNDQGLVDIEEIRKHCDENLAGIMLTNPNTLGLFENEIIQIQKLVHQAGGLLYYDGANFNAIMGKVKPGAMGFDCVHLNLHKTFSTPHGGGGPGSGPILVNDKLRPFLPMPDIIFDGEKYMLDCSKSDSIGKVSGFYGNIAVMVRAYTYILFNGEEGLKHVSEMAVLNANYIKERLKNYYYLPYDKICKHEFVFSGKKIKEEFGVNTLDIAKRLLDNGIHPPTIYFPLIVPEAMMIEPTETETKETLDHFIEVMVKIYEEAKNTPDILHQAPVSTVIRRVDEILAAKKPQINHFFHSDK